MSAELNLYDQDFFAWTQEQAKLIKEKSFDKLDFINLIEEVDSIGKREKRELSSRLSLLLMHLLKWKYQPTHRVTSWELTIKEKRNELIHHLKENPSLRNPENLTETFEHAYEIAILKAAKETKLSPKAFPAFCEWNFEQALNSDFYPN